METTIEQQVAMDEALVPSAQRCPFFKAFLVTADVPEIHMQEFWATVDVHHHAIQFKMDNKKHIMNLESFREMLHICPRIPSQSFAELPFEEEILDFIRFLGHSASIRTLTYVNINKLYQPWRSFTAIINKCLTGKSSVEHKNYKKSNDMYYPRFTKVIIHHFMSKDPSIPRRNKVNWHYVRDDFMFSTIKLVSRQQNTQQFGALLPIELTNEEIRNSKAYKEYYANTTGEAAPKPKASARRTRSGSDTSITPPTAATTLRPTVAATLRLTVAAKGKQTAKAPKAKTKDKSPSDPSELARTEAQQLKIVLRRSQQKTHISQLGGFGTDEGTGSKPGVPDVPFDDSEEEISWNSSDDEDVDAQEKNRDDDEGDEKDESDDREEDDDDERDDDDDDDDDEEEITKTNEQDDAKRGGDDDEETKSDEESDGDETKEEESFDLILRTPEDSEDDGNGEEDQGLRISEEERIHEEEEADELYRDVNINQGRGLQLYQDVKDSHEDAEGSGDDDEEGESDEEDDDEETRDEESFDPIPQTPESSEDDGNDEEDQGLKIG
nr:hypothetical protein [Tanacetum cinerariifolium]